MVVEIAAHGVRLWPSRALDRKRLCRTFSDCTTAPRNGMISGCYPLDEIYKALPEAEALKRVKAQLKLEA